MTKIDIDDAVLILVVSRKPNPLTGLDVVEVVKPTSMQDTLRINRALNHAQRTLFELTQSALNEAKIEGKET